MTTSTFVIIGAAILLLLVVLALLARTGRKLPEGPAEDGIAMVSPATELSPAADEPLPEPGSVTAPGLATAELVPVPVVESVPEPVAEAETTEAPASPADPLTRLKGLGPKAEAVLNGLGVTRFEQIAAWTEADITRIDAQMGNFKGRITRDRWVEQARYLTADDIAGFEAIFGKLG